MSERCDIAILGSGAFAARIASDIAATAREPVTVGIAGRNADRVDWLRTAGNARAALFGTPARFVSRLVDLAAPGAPAECLGAFAPKLVVQAASTQTSSVIARRDSAWSQLVAEGGLSATAVAQSLLSLRVGQAIAAAGGTAPMINCCFPDVVNGLLAARGISVLSGIGNVAILSNAYAGLLGPGSVDRLHLLAHYQTLAAWRRPAAERSGPTPRVWLDGQEIADVFGRFQKVKLTREPAIEISGASGVPLMLAFAGGRSWRGHVPAPGGLPGGYPVVLREGRLALDLPPGIAEAEAIAWNAGFEQRNGLSVDASGRATYSGKLRERLAALSPELAKGFHVRDLETVYAEMDALRRACEAQAQ